LFWQDNNHYINEAQTPLVLGVLQRRLTLL